jgi:hypothetical protein
VAPEASIAWIFRLSLSTTIALGAIVSPLFGLIVYTHVL